MDTLVGLVTRAIQFKDHVLATPVLGPAIKGLTFLAGSSGAFWFLFRRCGIIALKIHDNLHEDLAELFALTYNVVLASLFGGVMALAVARAAREQGFTMVFEAAGFILVYVVLGATYGDEKGTVNAHNGAGYTGGIAAFILGCTFPHWTENHPYLIKAHEFSIWFTRSPIGKVIVVLSVVQGILYLLDAVRRWFFWKSIPIRGRRFFFEPA
jgi:hypothetical protein